MNLSDLMHDAVDGIEPADRIEEIRARTTTPARSAARPWLIAAGATVLATAATVAVVAALSTEHATEMGPMHHHDDSPIVSATPGTQAVPVYFIGDTPAGPRLFREFDPMAGFDSVQLALDRMQRTPSDPDYRTLWPAGSFGQVTVKDDRIDVELNDPAAVVHGLAAQQVVYTLQGAAGQRLPVYFWRDGQYGNAPVTAAPMGETLSPVNISDPAQGNDYAGSLVARGRAMAGEGTSWQLRQGDDVVRDGTVVVGEGDTLLGWEVTVDLTDVPPGTYTFAVTQDNPPNAFSLPASDTRTITVR